MPDWIMWLLDSGFAAAIGGLILWSYKAGERVGGMSKRIDDAENRLDKHDIALSDITELKVNVGRMMVKLDNVSDDVKVLKDEGAPPLRAAIAAIDAKVEILMKKNNL